MTKLGTPIGAGPKGAKVVVGLVAVGEPPSSYWAPPSGPSASGWSPPPLTPGAVTAPVLPPPPLVSPSASFWVAPPLPGEPPAIVLPCLTPPPCFSVVGA